MALVGPVLSGREGGQTRLSASSSPGKARKIMSAVATVGAVRRTDDCAVRLDIMEAPALRPDSLATNDATEKARRRKQRERRWSGSIIEAQALRESRPPDKELVTEAAILARMAALRHVYQQMHRRSKEQEKLEASRCSSGTSAVSWGCSRAPQAI